MDNVVTNAIKRDQRTRKQIAASCGVSAATLARMVTSRMDCSIESLRLLCLEYKIDGNLALGLPPGQLYTKGYGVGWKACRTAINEISDEALEEIAI